MNLAALTSDDLKRIIALKLEIERHEKEGYLENVSHLNSKNPAWQIYFDRTMEGYLFPVLLRYENDPKLKDFYTKLLKYFSQ